MALKLSLGVHVTKKSLGNLANPPSLHGLPCIRVDITFEQGHGRVDVVLGDASPVAGHSLRIRVTLPNGKIAELAPGNIAYLKADASLRTP